MYLCKLSQQTQRLSEVHVQICNYPHFSVFHFHASPVCCFLWVLRTPGALCQIFSGSRDDSACCGRGPRQQWSGACPSCLCPLLFLRWCFQSVLSESHVVWMLPHRACYVLYKFVMVFDQEWEVHTDLDQVVKGLTESKQSGYRLQQKYY